MNNKMIPDDVNMVVLGEYHVWHRFSNLWPDIDNVNDVWTSLKQGAPNKTTEQLFALAKSTNTKVRVLVKGDEL